MFAISIRKISQGTSSIANPVAQFVSDLQSLILLEGRYQSEPCYCQGREFEDRPNIYDLQEWDTSEGDDLPQPTGIGVLSEALLSVTEPSCSVDKNQ